MSTTRVQTIVRDRLYDEVSAVITERETIVTITNLAKIPQGDINFSMATNDLWWRVIEVAEQSGCMPSLVFRISKRIARRTDAAKLKEVLELVKSIVGPPVAEELVDDVREVSTAISVLIAQTDPRTAFGITQNLRLSVVNIYEFLDDPAASMYVLPGLDGETERQREVLIGHILGTIAALDKLQSIRSSRQSSPRVSDDQRDKERRDEAYQASLIDGKMDLVQALRSLRTEMSNAFTLPDAGLGPDEN